MKGERGQMTLLELLSLLKKHLGLVIALPVVCALAMGLYSIIFMGDTYTASTSMYVLSSNESSSTSLSTDLSASQMVANDVATLLESDRAITSTAEDLGLDDLDDYSVSVSSATTSRVITLSVTGTSAEGAAAVANAMVQNVAEIAVEVMGVEAVNVIDQATAPANPSGPNRPLYAAVAFLAGLFLAVAIVVMGDMLNTKVRSQDEVEELLGVPVIGRIPAMKGVR